jgi:signal transduction histidine kinase
MRRVTILLSLFFLALAIPLAYFVLRAYRGMEQEEKAALQYFATTLFDGIEAELAALTLREEQRAVDEYSYYRATALMNNTAGQDRSPLANLPPEQFILGYLQSNPDGSFQTPLIEPGKATPSEIQPVVARLRTVNEFLKQLPAAPPAKLTATASSARSLRQEITTFAGKYLDVSQLRKQQAQVQQREQPVTQVTRDQVLNITQNVDAAAAAVSAQAAPVAAPQNLQVEVSPLEATLLPDAEILVFRRIVINQEMYRQGFVISTPALLNYLRDSYFTGQPLAQFANLRLEIRAQERTSTNLQAGAPTKKPVVSVSRTFTRPFTFLKATIACDRLPKSTGRWILNVMRIFMAAIILTGLLAIYQSVRTVVELSERRTAFVSSVTHELKTPLTTIRMYIEMLEQGVAPNREREQDYFRIVSAEAGRLSRLIDNVLEFAKLEKKQRRFNLHEGDFDDVLRGVQDILQAKLAQEGVHFTVIKDELRPFWYDREVMVQIMLNLLDNSIKFGKTAPVKEITVQLRSAGSQVILSVADTGPGIPAFALKKIFADFYRVDAGLTRTTPGTGIGLALVKKFVNALGGNVKAANNNGPGCTITIVLPQQLNIPRA